MRVWSIVCLLSLGMVIAYVDRTNLSVALAAAEFKTHFGLTDSDRGVLNSAFFWTYTFLQIPAGFVVDRWGVKRPYTIMFFLWCLISAATAWAGSLGQLIGVRMLLGVGEAVVTPASLRWIRYHIDEKQRGLAVGIYMAGTKYGPAVGAPLAAWLLTGYGWQNMFIILGLGGLVWLLPWLLLVKDDDRALEQTSAASGPAIPFAHIFRRPAIWGILIGTFCYNYFVYFSMTWLPAYLVERRNLPLDSGGWFTGFSFGGMATVAILSGFAADRLITRGWDPVRTRKGFTIAGFMLASTEVIGAFADSTNVAVFFAILSLSGLGLATPNYWALTQTLMPGAAIGRIAGVQNTASNFAGIAAPVITGWLKQSTGSFEAPMQAIWFFLILGIGAYVFLVRRSTALPATAHA